MDLKLEGKNVFISASSAGIGKSIAELYLEENCNVVISSSNKDKLEKTASDLKKIKRGSLFYAKCDINKEEDINKAFQAAEERFGDINILVNNCGGPAPGFLSDLNDEMWEEGFEQVLMSTVRFTRLALPNMKKNKWGRIINITSISVKQPIDNLLLSNAFRSGVTAFSKTLSNQVGEFGITINNVAPGLTLTGRLKELATLKAKEANITVDQMLEEMALIIPLKRIGSPSEIASAVVYLSSEIGGYINGQTIVVDGGFNKSTY